MKMYRTFTENLPTIFPKIIFHEISPKLFFTKLVQNHFPKVFCRFSNFPRIVGKIIVHEFYRKHFPEFHNFSKFSENFETILINVHFQFCSAVESIGQDGAILPDDKPMKLRESRAG